MRNQPANSPDFNVLDLGFFNAIQSLQHQIAPTSIEELVTAVETAFRQLEPSKLNDCFLTLQSVMECTMACDGGNSYRLPHLKKAANRSQGNELKTVFCKREVLDRANAFISNAESK